MLLNWGRKLSDEAGLETVVISTPAGRLVYENCGFTLLEIMPQMEINSVGETKWTDAEREQWREYASEDLGAYLLWRPAGHDFVEGVDAQPC